MWDRTTGIMNIVVHHDMCTGCGFCVDSCPQGVFELKDGVSHVVNADDCLECHLCEVSCEPKAITLQY